MVFLRTRGTKLELKFFMEINKALLFQAGLYFYPPSADHTRSRRVKPSFKYHNTGKTRGDADAV